MTHEAGAFEVRQEEDSIAAGRLVKIAGLAVGVGLIGVFFAALLLEAITGGIRGRMGDQSPRAATPTFGNLEQTPLFGAAEGLDLQRRQREELSRYRWVDRDAGLAAIPIERAMDIVERESR